MSWYRDFLNRNCIAKKSTIRNTRKRSKHADEQILPYPFPKLIYFGAYSDGAVLGMTAGSSSGMTLIDVVNIHQTSGGGSVPELLVIHYTARMLLHLECLHRAKVLHCDVKPDNWVLTASNVACRIDNGANASGSDLMLVDFGRAIDLTTATKKLSDPLEIRLYGDIMSKDMACIAMREDKPWGADVDTFGLCSTVHVLLHGTYLAVKKDSKTDRWCPQTRLRRYWSKDLWDLFFDTLLNVNGTGKSNRFSSASYPSTIREIRKVFEEYLQSKKRQFELASLLRQQSGWFPRKRKK